MQVMLRPLHKVCNWQRNCDGDAADKGTVMDQKIGANKR